TGSQMTGNLVDTSALSNAGLNLAGGTLIFDPTASTASNGLASQYIAASGTPILTTLDLGGTAPLSCAPTVQGSAVAAAPGLTGDFAFGSNIPSANTSFGTNVPTTNFAVRWTGMIDIPTPGPTLFTAVCNEAMKVYVDNVLVVNGDGPHPLTSYEASI